MEIYFNIKIKYLIYIHNYRIAFTERNGIADKRKKTVFINTVKFYKLFNCNCAHNRFPNHKTFKSVKIAV